MKIEYETLMSLAYENAKHYRHKYIRTEHLLLAMLDAYPVPALHGYSECIRQAIAVMRCPICDAEEKLELSASAHRAYGLAQQVAAREPIANHHLLYGIVQSSITVQRLLKSCDVDVPALIQHLESELPHVQ